MENNQTKSKRIIKNTLMLYVRMILIMVISLFTSRIILQTLGIEDYGIYNVVGGVVTMFSFFTGSLSTAISRFITYELGKKNKKRLGIIFSTSVNVLLLLSLIIIVLIETFGVWFLNYKLNIPVERINAANWVMQCSILVFVINLISVPYNAAIIAHERMSAFAYISILEVTLKLAVAYMLYISPVDKLITYAVLLVLVALFIRLSYGIYCSKNFEECKYQLIYDKSLIKQMIGFAGWNLMGTGAYLFNTQGVNIVTNLFFGVTFNAARGIATQVEGIVKQFVNNFTTALNPQITKSYAEGDMDYMNNLVCRGAKYSYFLMLLFTIPFLYEADEILKIWLGNVPEHAGLFLRLTMLGTLIDILGNSTANAAWATGDIKKYYIYVAGVGCLVFPLSYIAFALGFPAYTSYFIFIFIYIIVIFIKLYIIKGLLNFPVTQYYREVFSRIIPVSILSFSIPSVIFLNMEAGFIRVVVLSLVSAIMTLLCIYALGLENTERAVVISKYKNFKSKL
ncbi:MAG: lipopolysaccharide biosynthesis protein [Bacteroides sp.]|nr:lipopolysaccharide biosynthesis protein [Bacteroides sp.]